MPVVLSDTRVNTFHYTRIVVTGCFGVVFTDDDREIRRLGKFVTTVSPYELIDRRMKCSVQKSFFIVLPVKRAIVKGQYSVQ